MYVASSCGLGHFEQFGEIVDIKLHKPTQSAVVSYAHVSEAKAAMECPDPVFNNRFIKIEYVAHGSKGGEPNGRSEKREPKTPAPPGSNVWVSEAAAKKAQERAAEKKKAATAIVAAVTPTDGSTKSVAGVSDGGGVVVTTSSTDGSVSAKKKNLVPDLRALVQKKQEHIDELISQQKKLMAKLNASTNAGEKKGITKTVKTVSVYVSARLNLLAAVEISH